LTWAEKFPIGLNPGQNIRMDGFLPKDMENQFPEGLVQAPLTGLADYTDDFVIAWSGADVEKRPELLRLLEKLGVRSSGE
jgi:hypothetical protein